MFFSCRDKFKLLSIGTSIRIRCSPVTCTTATQTQMNYKFFYTYCSWIIWKFSLTAYIFLTKNTIIQYLDWICTWVILIAECFVPLKMEMQKVIFFPHFIQTLSSFLRFSISVASATSSRATRGIIWCWSTARVTPRTWPNWATPWGLPLTDVRRASDRTRAFHNHVYRTHHLMLFSPLRC